MTAQATMSARPRFAVLDLARGIAIGAMIVYHAAWDLSLVELVAEPVTDHLGWRLFAKAIAASFLVIVGISLTLAARAGLEPRPYLRRLAVIAGAAALVSIGTYLAFPERFVFFGILHHIAAASVLGLLFLRAPTWLVLAAVPAVIVAPLYLSHPVFDAPALWPLGLFTRSPDTVDFVPIFPWFAAVLAGIALGRALIAGAPARLSGWQPGSAPTRLLVRAGRLSLPIYLLHQPLLLAVLYGVVAVTGPVAREELFAVNCARECRTSGRDDASCRALCGCVLSGATDAGLRTELLSGRLEAAGRVRLGEIVRVCARAP
jgi:uncharacterized membrane protein